MDKPIENQSERSDADAEYEMDTLGEKTQPQPARPFYTKGEASAWVLPLVRDILAGSVEHAGDKERLLSQVRGFHPDAQQTFIALEALVETAQQLQMLAACEVLATAFGGKS